MGEYPNPEPGVVIRHLYLWKREADMGRVESAKDRPCVTVISVEEQDRQKIVTVALVTHCQPEDLDRAIFLTPRRRQRIGLYGEKNWIIAMELNRFAWPGPDLVPTPTSE